MPRSREATAAMRKISEDFLMVLDIGPPLETIISVGNFGDVEAIFTRVIGIIREDGFVFLD